MSKQQEKPKQQPKPEEPGATSEAPFGYTHAYGMSIEPKGSGSGASGGLLTRQIPLGTYNSKKTTEQKRVPADQVTMRDEVGWEDIPVEEGRKHSEEHKEELKQQEKSGAFSKIKEEEQKLYGYGIEASTEYSAPQHSD